MKKSSILLFLLFALFLSSSNSNAHGIDYEILDNKVIAIRVTYSSGEPLSFGSFEILGPDEKIIHQKGRTDKNGIITFLPDKKGVWKITVTDETEHGLHKRLIEIKVDENFTVESRKREFSDKYIKIIAGIGFIMGLFGAFAILKNRRKLQK